VTRWCPKTPSDHPMEKKKPWENPGSVGVYVMFSSGVYELEAKFTVTVR